MSNMEDAKRDSGEQIEKADEVVYGKNGRVDEEATRVLREHRNEAPITDEEIRRVRRKVDLRLMPVMAAVMALQTIDKGILGTGAVVGLSKDLGLFTTRVVDGVTITDTSRYSDVTMIFYVGNLLGAYPLTLLAQKFPIAKITTVYVLIWALVLYLICVCHDYHGAMAQRFFLGFMEAGIAPVFLLISSSWYTHAEQAFRVPIWYSSGIFGLGLSYYVNYGLTGIETSGFAVWKIIFIFWGSITTLFGIVIFLVLPDSVAKARWLSPREQYIAVERLRSNQDSIRNEHVNFRQILSALTDYKVWILFIMIYCVVIPNGLASTFTPVVVQGLGFSKRRALLLSGPGSITGAIFGLVGGYIGQYVPRTRTYIIVFEMLLTLVGALILWKVPHTNIPATLTGIYMVYIFSAAYVQMLALGVSNAGGYSKKTVVSSLMLISYALSNITAPKLFFKDESPSYLSSFKINSALLIVGVVFSIAYGLILTWENKRRDKMDYVDHAFEDLDDRKNMAFRYAT